MSYNNPSTGSSNSSTTTALHSSSSSTTQVVPLGRQTNGGNLIGTPFKIESNNSKSTTNAKISHSRNSSQLSGTSITTLLNSPSTNSNENKLWRHQFTPTELATFLLTPRELERQEVIHELITSELCYYKDLEIITQKFIQPLRQNFILNGRDLSTLFLCWEELEMLHKNIYQVRLILKNNNN
jgi:hypothetical protein